MNNIRYCGDWSEKEIIDIISKFHELQFLKFGSNSFCHRVIKALQNTELLTENSGHDCLPPDYYSDNLNIMFDIMRVNDSEKKKGYNPMYQEISKITKKVQQNAKMHDFLNVERFICDLKTDNGINYDEIHQFKYYKKQVVRVLEQHLNKLHIWSDEHPDITRKGFIIIDEAGIFFQGFSYPSVVDNNGYVKQWIYFLKRPLVVHYPWIDTELITPLIKSKIDFVIWYRPYTKFSTGNTKILHNSYKNLAVIDVRENTYLELYNYENSDDWFSIT